MQYIVKQKIFTIFKNKFDIYNEENQLEFHVVSNIFFPYKLFFYNDKNELIMVIKKRYFKVLKRYDIWIDNKFLASVKKRITLVTKKFKVKSKNEQFNEIKVQGDILGFNFNFTKDGVLLSSINKKFITIGDRYRINIEDTNNKEFYLALAIVIDEMVHKRKK